ncbi:MAG TPA: hypothetical protein VJU16_00145 [Planctomycetota bacterium]|nr:hypothetical protein [Planctomycetota bacterium]
MKNNHRGGSGGGFMRTLSAQSGRVAGDMQELGRVTVDNLRRKGKEALKVAKKTRAQVQSYVHANPVRSVLIAMGIGALVGYILHRRK